MMLETSVIRKLLISILWITIWASSSLQDEGNQNVENIIAANETLPNFNLVITKTLDVEKLNNLLSIFDKRWILPNPLATNPVGSNFKYKKTCAKIYKSHVNPCQQIGFGTLCFNYCFEQGEKLNLPCEDVFDASYCKNNSAFNSFLMQYQNTTYKAKAYIRQMISRCYGTAICDTQNGILNASIIDEEWRNNEIKSNFNLTTTNNEQTGTLPATRERFSEKQPKRPISIQKLLLLRHRTTIIPQLFHTVKAVENSRPKNISSEEFEKIWEYENDRERKFGRDQ